MDDERVPSVRRERTRQRVIAASIQEHQIDAPLRFHLLQHQRHIDGFQVEVARAFQGSIDGNEVIPAPPT